MWPALPLRCGGSQECALQDVDDELREIDGRCAWCGDDLVPDVDAGILEACVASIAVAYKLRA